MRVALMMPTAAGSQIVCRDQERHIAARGWRTHVPMQWRRRPPARPPRRRHARWLRSPPPRGRAASYEQNRKRDVDSSVARGGLGLGFYKRKGLR